MPTVAVIQARTGSTRLPGKVMYPLAGKPVLANVVERVRAADTVDQTVVATSTKAPDDVVEACASRAGAAVVRGSEDDVLKRFHRVVEQHDPDTLVRVSADCPLLSLAVLDSVVERLHGSAADYSSNTLERTFPRGLDIEAFSTDSFTTVHEEATETHHREHVTPYYHEDERFERVSVTSTEVFDEELLHDRTDLRLTLDEPEDYELLRRVYGAVQYDNLLPILDAVRYIDERGLEELNAHVEQKPV